MKRNFVRAIWVFLAIGILGGSYACHSGPSFPLAIGPSRDFYKCDGCRELQARVTHKYHFIAFSGEHGVLHCHHWEKTDGKTFHDLAIRWHEIEWNKCGFWYRVLTNDNSAIDEAIQKKEKIWYYPDYWRKGEPHIGRE